MATINEQYYKKPEETIEQYYARTLTPDRPGEAITPASMAPEKPIEVLPPTDTMDWAAMLKGINDSNNTYNKTISSPTTPIGTDTDALLKKWLSGEAGNEPPSLTEQYGAAYEQAGIGGKEQAVIESQKQLDLLNAQLAGLTAEATGVPIQIQQEAIGRGVTKGGMQPIETGRLREIALKALPLQAQILAQQAVVTGNQGALKLAQDKLDTMFSLKSKDIENTYNYNKDLRDKIWDYATSKEKDKLTAMQKADDRKYEEEKARIKEINEWSKLAIANGQSDLVSDFSKLDTKDPDFISKLGAITSRIVEKQETYDTIKDDSGNVWQVQKDAQGRIVNQELLFKGEAGGDESGSVEGWANLLSTGQGTIANVPQKIRNKVVDYLAKNSIDIKKQLSDTAVKEITQTESALSSLDDLRAVIQNNLQFVGPISGLARFNPWSDARKAQADIDRVRQTVGKALEGGVLRKEDEEKYKKILATLGDTPETALYKIDSLVSTLQRDLQNYKESQLKAGRYVENINAPKLEDLRTKYNY